MKVKKTLALFLFYYFYFFGVLLSLLSNGKKSVNLANPIIPAAVDIAYMPNLLVLVLLEA